MAEPVTPEIIGPCDRRRFALLVIGLVSFLVAANFASIVVLDRYPMNRSNWLVREKWRLLDRSHGVDTLVLGDSSCTQAVRPDVLERALGGRSLNLCTVGNMLAINDVWMLDEYLRRHGRPRRVVIVHVYHAWNRAIDSGFAQLLGKIDRPWSFWTEARPAVDLAPARLADVAISRWLPLYGEHRSLRRLIWERDPPRFELDDRGFMAVTRANPERVRADHAAHVKALASVQPTSVLSVDNHRALVRLRELAERHELDVTIVPAPIYDELWRTPAVQDRVRWLHTALQQVLAGSRVRIVTEPPPTFGADEMENVDHIVGDAAIRYTRWLGVVVARR